jgi:hypothetical protein
MPASAPTLRGSEQGHMGLGADARRPSARATAAKRVTWLAENSGVVSSIVTTLATALIAEAVAGMKCALSARRVNLWRVSRLTQVSSEERYDPGDSPNNPAHSRDDGPQPHHLISAVIAVFGVGVLLVEPMLSFLRIRGRHFVSTRLESEAHAVWADLFESAMPVRPLVVFGLQH